MPTIFPLNYRSQAIHALTREILQIILAPCSASKILDYQAGQYLMLQAGNSILPFSIANAPAPSGELELHIRKQPGDTHLQEILTQLQQAKSLRITAVAGCCQLPANKAPLLIIAGGTGFAVAKALLEQLIEQQDDRSVQLYWATRSPEDIYFAQQLQHYQANLAHFNYCIFTTTADATLNNLPKALQALNISNQRLEHSMLDAGINQLTQPLANWEVLAAGPANLIKSCWQALQLQGLRPTQLHTDMIDVA